MALDIRIAIAASNKLRVFGLCTVSREVYGVTVDFKQWQNWQLDKLTVEEAFPELTPEQRNFLVTELTPNEVPVSC